MLLPAVLICVATRADQEALAKRNATRPRTGSSDGPEASAQVMQTVLSSKVLQRVVFAVIEKVLRTWPKARGGFADCQRYREALQQVLEDVQRHARENSGRITGCIC